MYCDSECLFARMIDTENDRHVRESFINWNAIVGENMCEIRVGSVNHTAYKALNQEPFLLPNYIPQTGTDENLQAV